MIFGTFHQLRDYLKEHPGSLDELTEEEWKRNLTERKEEAYGNFNYLCAGFGNAGTVRR